MKKILILFMLASVMLSAVGCYNRANNTVENNTGETQDEMSEGQDSTPSYSYAMYNFKSIDVLHDSLMNNGKGVYIRGYDNKKHPERYITMLDRFEQGEITLKYPVIDGYGEEYLTQDIILFTVDAYQIPWIWYRRCYDNKTMAVKITYLSDEVLEYSQDHNICEVINRLDPRFGGVEALNKSELVSFAKEETVTTVYGVLSVLYLESSLLPTTKLIFILDDMMVAICGPNEEVNYDLINKLSFVKVDN